MSNKPHHYSHHEIEKLADSGKLLSTVLKTVAQMVKPGMSTKKLDDMAEKMIRDAGGEPAFLGYESGGPAPYPASLCVSINEEIVHCIPEDDRILQEGQIVSLDLGVRYKGMITDMAMTVGVGKITPRNRELIDATRGCLDRALQVLRPGITTGDLGAAIYEYGNSRGFHVIRDLVGHGVGHEVHEPPQVPNYGQPGKGVVIKPGMVLAIEPMLSLGSEHIRFLPDGWGIITADHSYSAHFEKTVAVLDKGIQVLTP